MQIPDDIDQNDTTEVLIIKCGEMEINELTVIEARERKEKLQTEILSLLQQFQKETNLVINQIDVYQIERYDPKWPNMVAKINIKIPV